MRGCDRSGSSRLGRWIGRGAALLLLPSVCVLVLRDELADHERAISTPIGGVVPYAGTDVPEGWLLCDGQSLDRDLWPELYLVIGTTHGAGVTSAGAPVGDFNLPDYRGRFLRGVDRDVGGRPSGADPDAPARGPARGGTGNRGNAVGSYQGDATALPRSPRAPFAVRLRGRMMDRPGSEVTRDLLEVPIDGHGHEEALVFGGDAETRPRNVAVRWIIRAK